MGNQTPIVQNRNRIELLFTRSESSSGILLPSSSFSPLLIICPYSNSEPFPKWRSQLLWRRLLRLQLLPLQLTTSRNDKPPLVLSQQSQKREMHSSLVMRDFMSVVLPTNPVEQPTQQTLSSTFLTSHAM